MESILAEESLRYNRAIVNKLENKQLIEKMVDYDDESKDLALAI